MLEKPNLSDAKILTCLNASFGIQAEKLEFLPIGNDSSAWVYRVESDLQDYFLKVRKGALKMAMLEAPHYLQQQGIQNIVAPIETATGDLYAPFEDFSLILYPLIDGTSAWGLTLTDAQWQAWGKIMRQIHSTSISDDMANILPRETFVSKWDEMFNRVDALIQKQAFDDPIQWQTAALWKQKHDIIHHSYQRLVALGKQLQAQEHQFMICHADIHQANIMIDGQGQIQIVDWDEVIIAPKERDLMFFVEDGHSSQKVIAFMQGYGEVDVNQIALSYYRYEWVVQEYGDYGERIFFNDELSEIEKQASFDEFKQLFDAGDVVDLAIRSDDKIIDS